MTNFYRATFKVQGSGYLTTISETVEAENFKLAVKVATKMEAKLGARARKNPLPVTHELIALSEEGA